MEIRLSSTVTGHKAHVLEEGSEYGFWCGASRSGLTGVLGVRLKRDGMGREEIEDAIGMEVCRRCWEYVGGGRVKQGKGGVRAWEKLMELAEEVGEGGIEVG